MYIDLISYQYIMLMFYEYMEYTYIYTYIFKKIANNKHVDIEVTK